MTHSTRQAARLRLTSTAVAVVAAMLATAVPGSPAVAAPGVRPVDVRFEAESFDAQHGIRVLADRDATGGRAVRFSDGDWVRYDGVDFGATPRDVSGYIAWRVDGYGPGTLELRLDSPDSTPLWSVSIDATGRRCCTWGDSSIRYVPATAYGVHSLYLSYRSSDRRSYWAVDNLTVLKQTAIPIP